MKPRVLHRPALPAWRSRHLAGALRVRPPVAQHSEPEAELLKRYAANRRCIVEIGVAEGGSAVELREVMHPDGSLFLVDPYQPGALGFSLALVVARRVVKRAERGEVVWIRKGSDDAAVEWRTPIDFLFIDGDHRYEAAKADWDQWSGHLAATGVVALHDSLPSDWTSASDGPVRVVREILEQDAGWILVDRADSTAILGRATDA